MEVADPTAASHTARHCACSLTADGSWSLGGPPGCSPLLPLLPLLALVLLLIRPRSAVRCSGQAVATSGFRLTQAEADDTGVVIYQALYRGSPADEASRVALFRGVVFVTVNTERTMKGVATADQAYLRWCLVDPAPGAARR